MWRIELDNEQRVLDWLLMTYKNIILSSDLYVYENKDYFSIPHWLLTVITAFYKCNYVGPDWFIIPLSPKYTEGIDCIVIFGNLM